MESGPYSDTILHLVFCAFQMMFAIITPTLISGAFAERIKFPAFLVFTVVWTSLVYLPVCHWLWGGGFIGEKIKALDFAGGTVIHINSVVAALVTEIIIVFTLIVTFIILKVIDRTIGLRVSMEEEEQGLDTRCSSF